MSERARALEQARETALRTDATYLSPSGRFVRVQVHGRTGRILLDSRGRVAVRNINTDRLFYVHEADLREPAVDPPPSGASPQADTCEEWRTAALAKDRTRREIRRRTLIQGESAESVASDFGVPVKFVTHLMAWQFSADEPASLLITVTRDVGTEQYAAEFLSADGKTGGMGDYSGTEVGALANLCATLIKVAENESVERREAIQPAPVSPVAGDSPTTPDKRTTGLYAKFAVTRTDGSSAPGGKHDGCDYFVLDLTHDPHAAPALRAYADSCRADYPLLAADLDANLPPVEPASEPPSDLYANLLDWRGLDRERDAICGDCGGAGTKTYGSTATWRGGIGGQMLTTAVCDKCWGSGNTNKPWPSHRVPLAPVSPVEPEPPTTCRCLDCEPLTDPVPKPSEDDINRLEKAAWDSKTDLVLVWYRDRAEMFRQRLRETERAWQLDRKKPTVEPEPCVWRDISTAPKDGTEVLLLWHDAETGAAPMHRVGSWHSREQAWCDTHRVLHNQQSHPTHWTPLPGAPLKVEKP